MTDIQRHSPEPGDTTYTCTTSLATCDAIDFRHGSAAIVVNQEASQIVLTPYVSKDADGTFAKLNAQSSEDNTMTIPANEAMDVHSSLFSGRFVKFLEGSGSAEVAIMLKG